MKDKAIDFAAAAEQFSKALFGISQQLSQAQGKFTKEEILRNGEKLDDLNKEAADKVKELNRELVSLQNKLKTM